MQGNLATRVMSHTVAAGMTTLEALGKLPKNSKTSINFIQFFNTLFLPIQKPIDNIHMKIQRQQGTAV